MCRLESPFRCGAARKQGVCEGRAAVILKSRLMDQHRLDCWWCAVAPVMILVPEVLPIRLALHRVPLKSGPLLAGSAMMVFTHSPCDVENAAATAVRGAGDGAVRSSCARTTVNAAAIAFGSCRDGGAGDVTAPLLLAMPPPRCRVAGDGAI